MGSNNTNSRLTNITNSVNVGGISSQNPPHANLPIPVANAGSPQTVHSGDKVMLDGSKSYDINSNPLTYQWKQIGGPTADINLVSQNPVFSAPNVCSPATLTFHLIVNNGYDNSKPATVSITVYPLLPVANAKIIMSNNEIILINKNSFDPNGHQLTFHWKSSDPRIPIPDPSPPILKLHAPTVSVATTITFQLIVNNDCTDSKPAEGTITLYPPPPPESIHIESIHPGDPQVGELISISGTTTNTSRSVTIEWGDTTPSSTMSSNGNWKSTHIYHDASTFETRTYNIKASLQVCNSAPQSVCSDSKDIVVHCNPTFTELCVSKTATPGPGVNTSTTLPLSQQQISTPLFTKSDSRDNSTAVDNDNIKVKKKETKVKDNSDSGSNDNSDTTP